MKAVEQGEIPESIQVFMENRMREQFLLTKYFKEGFEPATGDIHVLIEVLSAKKRRSKVLDGDVVEESDSWKKRIADYSDYWWHDYITFSVASALLPSLDELEAFVTLPLPSKIGLDDASFKTIAEHIDAALLNKMCVVNEDKPCFRMNKSFRAQANQPNAFEPTESGFSTFWNTLIRQFFNWLIPGGHTDYEELQRQQERHSVYPDMFFKMDSVLVLPKLTFCRDDVGGVRTLNSHN